MYICSRTQAVRLDNNSLTSVPDLSMFNGTGTISLQHNLISEVSSATFAVANDAFYLYVHLEYNMITALPAATFSGFSGASLFVHLENNSIANLTNDAFMGNFSPGTFLIVSLENNSISSLPPSAFRGFVGNALLVFLERNQITMLPTAAFGGFGGIVLTVQLQGNAISVLAPNVFRGFTGRALNLSMADNQLTSLPTAVFNGFPGEGLFVTMKANHITSLERIFDGYTASGVVIIDLSWNQIDGVSLKTALNSFSTSAAQLSFSLQGNAVRALPSHLFSNIASSGSIEVYGRILLDVSANPIATVDGAAFSGVNGYLQSVIVNMSYPTGGAKPVFDGALNFSAMTCM
jgi:Leucine-rich repeat (LRR) protein